MGSSGLTAALEAISIVALVAVFLYCAYSLGGYI